MAKKSKVFSELLREQWGGDLEKRSISQLAQKIQKTDQGQNRIKMVTTPKDMEKMSEVLESFVEPYLSLANNHNQRKRLFDIGVIAWNLTILPGEKRQSKVKKILEDPSVKDFQTVGEDSGKVIEALMDRKQKLFSANRRYIVEFNLVDTPNSYHISVAATLTDPFASD